MLVVVALVCGEVVVVTNGGSGADDCVCGCGSGFGCGEVVVVVTKNSGSCCCVVGNGGLIILS